MDKQKKAPCLAVFGTGSDVGKSVVATALCRKFARQGIAVAPFKAQNMSNNSGVTAEGLEMGRAQIVQAEAAGVAPHVDMNPILLKPTGETGSQVVLLGNAVENSTAMTYHLKKEQLFAAAAGALDRLRQQYELVIIEGAGSCAEVNLMPHDIVNFRVAQYASAPVILVADIHKGGVFAQIVGTLQCLSEEQRDLIRGFVINRFRGDIRLFQDGVDWIEQKTAKKVFGVLPWYTHFQIDAEDSVVIEQPEKRRVLNSGLPRLAVIRLPHISNFTDFDPLLGTAALTVEFLETVKDLDPYAAVILPGSKNTRADLKWLRESGWGRNIDAFAKNGGHILGICGGYQMMGHNVHDPDGLEGPPGTSDGLSLLPIETTLRAPKTTTRTEFTWQDAGGTGYEIHMGHTKHLAGSPLLTVNRRNGKLCDSVDGNISPDHKIMGTYIHGFFDVPGIANKWLASIGLTRIQITTDNVRKKEQAYDLLAQHFDAYVDIDGLITDRGLRKRTDG